ncbi:polysaccharide biosynthesis/export family protein [Pseudoxanthomonas suwonensis]|uniref:Capsular biosynthesis protein n=1 Tax=Pseudoxanthomonas suwonensis TaxID=314722 RepID=A0A0E3UNB3_9GAMM|nr:polysaccharide biosynthesis/export family protein [Pseudoxanthomonas suwonensis]AKC86805.1 capsular biosynthesis protein [Pseudoxanthomonas suwonensis]
MNLYRPFAIAVLAMSCLSGCLWSPGQHLGRTTPGPAQVRTAGNDQLDLIAITPKLIAMDRAVQGNGAIPPALAEFQPPAYTIGPGDVLYITVWDHPELTVPAGPQQQLNAAGRLVQGDGTLFYPYVGKLQAAGKTPTALRDELASRLSKVIESPQVDVSILTYASQRVWVTGAAQKSAVVPLTVVPLTLHDAISNAGFDPNDADLSGVRLTRDGATYTLDMARLGGRPIYLQANDHIYIPYLDAKEVFVVGEVNLPGAQNFKTGSISLSQALGRSRGLAQATSNGNAVYVIRGSNDLQAKPSVVYQLEAANPAAFAVASQFELLPGDVVFVGTAGITRWSRFVSQLLPFSGIISNAASVSSDLSN